MRDDLADLADFKCRVRVQGCAFASVVRGVRAIAMPGHQMPGYEADVIGGGMDGDSEQEHGRGDNDGLFISGAKSLP